jgi:hypothetical protein
MSALVRPDLVWLAEGLLTFLVFGLAVAGALGLLLVLRPSWGLTMNALASRWVDTQQRMDAMERPVVWERFFYRHHRVLGAAVALGASYVLWQRAFNFDQSELIAAVNPRLVHSGFDALLVAADVLGVILHVLALAVGLVILLRPSLLKSVERTANQWHRGPSTRALDAVVGDVDHGVAVYPRLWGALILVLSAWCLAGLVPLLQQTLAR